MYTSEDKYLFKFPNRFFRMMYMGTKDYTLGIFVVNQDPFMNRF